jgi:hypothetical protein|tara:strand:- start:985 stop:1317 length:333 start_codon:yes stop_codon:yes gene_type:complete
LNSSFSLILRKHMKTSTKLLLSGAVIISLSLIVFGTDAVLSLITFYQNLESPSARAMAEGISDSIGSALFGVAVGFLGVCVFIIGFISIFFEKRSPIDEDASQRRRFSEY